MHSEASEISLAQGAAPHRLLFHTRIYLQLLKTMLSLFNSLNLLWFPQNVPVTVTLQHYSVSLAIWQTGKISLERE